MCVCVVLQVHHEDFSQSNLSNHHYFHHSHLHSAHQLDGRTNPSCHLSDGSSLLSSVTTLSGGPSSYYYPLNNRLFLTSSYRGGTTTQLGNHSPSFTHQAMINSVSHTQLLPNSRYSSRTLLSSPLQPTYGSSGRQALWQGKSGSLSSLNEKTVPAYQVTIWIWAIHVYMYIRCDMYKDLILLLFCMYFVWQNFPNLHKNVCTYHIRS